MMFLAEKDEIVGAINIDVGKFSLKPPPRTRVSDRQDVRKLTRSKNAAVVPFCGDFAAWSVLAMSV
jgi:hypothetical protein